MSTQFQPELGQMIFGNNYERYDLDRSKFQDEMNEFLEKASELLKKDICNMGYASYFENEVFAVRPYYWGDCTCGYQEAEDTWSDSHDHESHCFSIKAEQFEAKLRQCGIKSFSDEYKDELKRFLKSESYPYLDEQGWRVYCDCSYEKEWIAWVEKNYHKENCPIILSNFHYKPDDVKINFYKYVGRSMSCNKPLTIEEFRKISKNCLKSLKAKNASR